MITPTPPATTPPAPAVTSPCAVAARLAELAAIADAAFEAELAANHAWDREPWRTDLRRDYEAAVSLRKRLNATYAKYDKDTMEIAS